MPPEDVVHVLGRMLEALRPGGIVLDLQVIRPDPVVECDGRIVCEIDGEPLFRLADAAAAAVDAAVGAGDLVEDAVDDHDVLKHHPSGADVLEDFAGSDRNVPEEAVLVLRALDRPCIVRERCRLRRLVLARSPADFARRWVPGARKSAVFLAPER